jgi:hypothetical protein
LAAKKNRSPSHIPPVTTNNTNIIKEKSITSP